MDNSSIIISVVIVLCIAAGMETVLELVTIPVQAVEPAAPQAAQALAQVLQASIT